MVITVEIKCLKCGYIDTGFEGLDPEFVFCSKCGFGGKSHEYQSRTIYMLDNDPTKMFSSCVSKERVQQIVDSVINDLDYGCNRDPLDYIMDCFWGEYDKTFRRIKPVSVKVS